MAWSDTTEGVNLNNAFEALRSAYTTTLPAHLTSLTNLANRPITG